MGIIRHLVLLTCLAFCMCTNATPVQPQTKGIFDFIDSLINTYNPISDSALKEYNVAIQSLPQFTVNTRIALNSLGNDSVQQKSITTPQAIIMFKGSLSLPNSAGIQIQSDINIKPMDGLQSITNQLVNVQKAVINALSIASSVNRKAATTFQSNITSLQKLTTAIINNCTNAAKEGSTGVINYWFNKPLARLMGDGTLNSIRFALQGSTQLLSTYSLTFTSMITSYPWIPFVIDAAQIKNQSYINAAITQATTMILNIVNGIISSTNKPLYSIAASIQQNIPLIYDQIFTLCYDTAFEVNDTFVNIQGISEYTLYLLQFDLDTAVLMGDLMSYSIQNGFKDLLREITIDVTITLKNMTMMSRSFVNEIMKVINATSVKSTKLSSCAIEALIPLNSLLSDSLNSVFTCVVKASNSFRNNSISIMEVLNNTVAWVIPTVQNCSKLSSDEVIYNCLRVSIFYM